MICQCFSFTKLIRSHTGFRKLSVAKADLLFLLACDSRPSVFLPSHSLTSLKENIKGWVYVAMTTIKKIIL